MSLGSSTWGRASGRSSKGCAGLVGYMAPLVRTPTSAHRLCRWVPLQNLADTKTAPDTSPDTCGFPLRGRPYLSPCSPARARRGADVPGPPATRFSAHPPAAAPGEERVRLQERPGVPGGQRLRRALSLLREVRDLREDDDLRRVPLRQRAVKAGLSSRGLGGAPER